MFYCEGMISSEMRYPTETSKKKKRYVTYKCKACGEVVEQVYAPSRYKQLCLHCIQHNLDTTGFIKKGTEIHKGKYNYSLSKFRGVTSQITIICPIHGEFTQRACEHLNGHGCNQCKFDQKSEDQLLPKEVWENRLKAYPLLSIKTWRGLGYHSQIELTCKIHGDFSVMLGQIGSSKYVCKECAWQKHQIQSIRPELIGLPTTLYYIYLPEIDMYKFGVTIKPKERFAQLGEVRVIATGVKEYTEAIRLEHKVFTKLDQYRYKGRKLLIKNGSTELFKKDVIKQIKRALQE